jgi:hypothetical protein
MAHHGRLGLTMLVTGALLVLVPIGIGVLVVGVVLRIRREQRDAADRGPE